MFAVSPLSPSPLSPASGPSDDQRIVFHRVAWKEYLVLRDLLDRPGLSMTYVRGALELMSPSREHELWKKNIARLVEHYAYLKEIDLRGYGSTTFSKKAKKLGAEPDECYLIGKSLGDFPEIVIEVVKTAPLLDKLEVYLGFGVPEVWVFRDGAFTVHVLDAAKASYGVVRRSPRLPGLDLEDVARYAPREDIGAAVREFERTLR